jgi:hypothetical protein
MSFWDSELIACANTVAATVMTEKLVVDQFQLGEGALEFVGYGPRNSIAIIS